MTAGYCLNYIAFNQCGNFAGSHLGIWVLSSINGITLIDFVSPGTFFLTRCVGKVFKFEER